MADIESDVPAIGIDLGTTYSCVGVYRHGQVEIIANDHGNRITPSCVVFTETERLIGEAAKNAMSVKPTNSVYDAKRLIGRRFDDPVVQEDMKHWPFQVINEGGKPKIKIEYKNETNSFLPEEISSMVLMKMKETAEAYLSKTVANAVLTVPAYFNDAQRRATKDAGTIAGLNIVRIINEPTAAAIAYGFRKMDGKERNVLIFDLGGGTFDVSILAIRNGIFKVRSTNGDTHLGGGDFDSRMVDHFVEEFKRKYKKDPSTCKRSLSRLRSACDRAKRSLSISAKASIDIDSFYEGEDFYTSITRARFEELNMDLFRSTIKFVQMAMDDAGMTKSQIEKIVLIGGSTRIPKIQKMVQDFFGGKKLIKSINPDEAVAYGATIQAAMLQGDKPSAIRHLLLFDVAPLSLGIETTPDRIMAPVVRRNTPIPTKITRSFTNNLDYQTTILIAVYEGEHALVEHNNLLGKFLLEGIPPVKRHHAQLDVTFTIEADGVLNVTATERTTGRKNAITIKNDENRPTRHQMELMIAEAERLRLEDAKQHERVLARNELEYYCYEIKSSAESRVLNDALLEKIEQTIHWLNDDTSLTSKEMSTKKEELEMLWNDEASLKSDPVDSHHKELLEEAAACSTSSPDDEEEIIPIANSRKSIGEVD